MLTATVLTIASAFVYVVGRWHYHAAEMADLCDMLAPRYRRDCYGTRTSYVHVAGGWRRTAKATQFVGVARDRVMITEGEVIPF